VEGSGRGIMKGTVTEFTGGTKKNHETPQRDSRSPGRILNPGPLEYEAGVLTTRLRRSVLLCVSARVLWYVDLKINFRLV
jgi:hypothetical protein